MGLCGREHSSDSPEQPADSAQGAGGTRSSSTLPPPWSGPERWGSWTALLMGWGTYERVHGLGYTGRKRAHATQLLAPSHDTPSGERV